MRVRLYIPDVKGVAAASSVAGDPAAAAELATAADSDLSPDQLILAKPGISHTVREAVQVDSPIRLTLG